MCVKMCVYSRAQNESSGAEVRYEHNTMKTGKASVRGFLRDQLTSRHSSHPASASLLVAKRTHPIVESYSAMLVDLRGRKVREWVLEAGEVEQRTCPERREQREERKVVCPAESGRPQGGMRGTATGGGVK